MNKIPLLDWKRNNNRKNKQNLFYVKNKLTIIIKLEYEISSISY